MQVIYTPDIFSAQRYGGISRYFVETIRRLPAGGVRPLVAAGCHRNAYLSEISGVLGLSLARVPKRRWLNALWCAAVASFHPGAIVHETYYRAEPRFRHHPTVLTVYDMIDEVWGVTGPNPAPSREMAAVKRLACLRATHLIAISEATKTDLVHLLGIDPAKVTVVHLATAFEPSPSRQSKPEPRPKRPAVLYVGARDGYKNFAVLLEAYAGSAALRASYDLVCFGGSAFSDEERRRQEALGVTGQVRWLTGPDAALRDAYESASAYVCPSLYEGFGIPVLEAMRLGCPVFCARTPALEEVAGEAAAYFDPRSSGELRAALETGLGQPDHLTDQVRLGRQRAQHFSWEKCAAETLAVYRSIG